MFTGEQRRVLLLLPSSSLSLADTGWSAAIIETTILNSAYVMVEILVSATPIRLLHVYQPLIYLTIYVLFTLIYYWAGGTSASGSHYIYSVLDWEEAGETMLYILIGAAISLLLYVRFYATILNTFPNF